MFLLAETTQAQEPAISSYLILMIIGVAIALMLYCIFTIYRNPHFNELQKFGWLILVLALPLIGPLAWITRARLEKKFRTSASGLQALAQESSEAASAVQPAHQPYRFSPFSAKQETTSEIVTADSPENPYLSQNQDGSRSLNF